MIFLEIDDPHRVAVFFNPSMKQLVPLFSKDEAERILKMVTELFPPNYRIPRSSHSTISEFAEFEFVPDNAAVADSAQGEIEAYLSYQPPPPGQDILQFWSSQEITLPRLALIYPSPRQTLRLNGCFHMLEIFSVKNVLGWVHRN